MPAEHDQLNWHFTLIETFGNFDHCGRTMAAEQDHSCRHIWQESELSSFCNAVYFGLLVKLRLQDHAGDVKNSLRGMSEIQRLLMRLFGAADDVLRFGFHPEMWRIVGKIGEQGSERHFRHNRLYALGNRAIEMWDYR